MEQESPHTIRPWLLITLIVVVLVAIGFIGWDYLDRQKAKTNTATPTTSNSVLDSSNTTSTSTNIKTNTATTPTSTGAPTITAINTYDINNNGKIDEIIIRFSGLMDKSINSTSGFKISGYNIDKTGIWSDGSFNSTNNDANISDFKIGLSEGNSFDTNAIPTITYDATLGNIKSSSDVSLINTTIKAIDSATPVAVSAVAIDTNNLAGIQTGDKVAITFSEPIKLKAVIDATNIYSQSSNKGILPLNQDVWLDGNNKIGSVILSSDNKILTISLSTNNGVPTVKPGDIIYIGQGNPQGFITDFSDKSIASNVDIKITGSF